MNKKLAYFDVTADLFLSAICGCCDNLPQDTKVVRVEADPSWGGHYSGGTNIIRLYCQSEQFPDTKEGESITQITPVARTSFNQPIGSPYA